MIKHNLYFEGNVQSLGFAENDTINQTLGLVSPGEYDFGVASKKETMQILFGTLTINGTIYSSKEAPCVIPQGSTIHISATSPAGYRCVYGD
ncbi:DUF1255 family protein [Candidatus Gracilibacteria bacterium]|nr:DUF1255 family protein [Candidatus Gracilibacteria bacterium]